MIKKVVTWTVRIFLSVSGLALIGLFLPRLLASIYAYPRTYASTNAPEMNVAIIFGAGLRRDGSPTAVLRDRVSKGVELYLSGKVQKLLMSGDNRSDLYDEPTAMRNYATTLGVPEDDIVLDYAGLRTYDTCYRARTIFGIHQAILVTQKFHLPRAIYTCDALGISAVGVAADRYIYRPFSLVFWNIRETLATLVAVVDVHITKPVPVMGQPDPIYPPEV